MMYRVSSKYNYYADKVFLENVRLLEELKYSTNNIDNQALKRSLKRKVLNDVVYVMHVLVRISEDKKYFFNDNGTIDICKWNMYFELAVELKTKILIPRNITIEEYVKGIH